MTTVAAVVEALERTDPAAADIFALFVLDDSVTKAYEDLLVTHGTELVAAATSVATRLRAAAATSYVSTVAKSADPALAAQVSQERMIAAADANAVVTALVDEVDYLVAKAEQSIQRDGWIQRVRRDDKGRFSRSLSGDRTRSLGQFALESDDPRGRGRRTLPTALEGDVQPVEGSTTGALEWNSNVEDPTKREQRERYLAAVADVDDLRRELGTAFGNKKAAEMIDISVRLQDAQGSMWADISADPTAPMMGWDPEATAVEVRYGAKDPSELPAESRAEADKINAQIALSQIPGLNLKTADPNLLSSLAGVMGPTNGVPRYDTPKANRYATALRSLSDAASVIPGTTGEFASGALRTASEVLSAGEDLRDPLTRTAYRLRGTTKTPDAGLVNSVTGEGLSNTEQAVVDATLGRKVTRKGETPQEVKQRWKPKIAELVAADPGSRSVGRDGLVRVTPGSELAAANTAMQREIAAAERRSGGAAVPQAAELVANDPGVAPVIRALAARQAAGQTGADALRGAQRDTAAAALLDDMIAASGATRAPGQKFTAGATLNPQDLSRVVDSVARGIGRGFPSEGVVIGADGQVKAQAIGMGEDHYLPFDLGSMKDLVGGSYVRTRTTGGMTGEDIRTLVLTGANAGTVVSASGVFDIKLADNLRGKRRFNDKVLRMAEMYERILDEIALGDHFAVDLTPEQERAIRLKLSKNPQLRGLDATSKTYRDARDAARAEERAKSMDLTDAEISAAQDDAIANFPRKIEGDPRADEDVRAAMDEAVATARRSKVRRLKVNGEGYEVALKTLQRYFPYYIDSVSRRDLKSFAATMNGSRSPQTTAAGFLSRNDTDSGYVAPGDLTASGRAQLKTRRTRAIEDARKQKREEAAAAAPAAGATPPTAPTPPPAATNTAAPTTAGEVAQIEDPGEVTAIDTARTKGLRMASRNWRGEIAALAGGAIDELDNAATRYKSPAPGEPTSFDEDNYGKSDVGLAFYAALNSGQDAAERAVLKLGTDVEAQSWLRSEEAKRALAGPMGIDAAEIDEKLDEVAPLVDNWIAVSQVIAAPWVDDDGEPLSQQYAGAPIYLEDVMAGVDTADGMRAVLASDDVRGVPKDLRDVLSEAARRSNDVFYTKDVANKLVDSAQRWEQMLGSADPDATDYRQEFSDIFMDGSPAERMMDETVLEAVQQVAGTADPAAMVQALVDDPDLVTRAADAAVLNYSLWARLAALTYAESDPKASAVFGSMSKADDQPPSLSNHDASQLAPELNPVAVLMAARQMSNRPIWL